MGSVKKAIRKVARVVVGKPKIAAPKPVKTVAQTVKKTAKAVESTAKDMAAKTGQGKSMYGGATLLTGAGGLSDEANVAKTILGGGGDVMKRKKKQAENMVG